MEEDEIQEQSYHVKIENITVDERLRGTIVISARSVKDLMRKIKDVYGFKEDNMKNIQLWSSQMGVVGRERLDILDSIPNKYVDIWIRGVANNTNNK